MDPEEIIATALQNEAYGRPLADTTIKAYVWRLRRIFTTLPPSDVNKLARGNYNPRRLDADKYIKAINAAAGERLAEKKRLLSALITYYRKRTNEEPPARLLSIMRHIMKTE